MDPKSKPKRARDKVHEPGVCGATVQHSRIEQRSEEETQSRSQALGRFPSKINEKEHEERGWRSEADR